MERARAELLLEEDAEETEEVEEEKALLNEREEEEVFLAFEEPFVPSWHVQVAERKVVAVHEAPTVKVLTPHLPLFLLQ